MKRNNEILKYTQRDKIDGFRPSLQARLIVLFYYWVSVVLWVLCSNMTTNLQSNFCVIHPDEIDNKTISQADLPWTKKSYKRMLDLFDK